MSIKVVEELMKRELYLNFCHLVELLKRIAKEQFQPAEIYCRKLHQLLDFFLSRKLCFLLHEHLLILVPPFPCMHDKLDKNMRLGFGLRGCESVKAK